MPKIKADQIVYLAVGVPEQHSDRWRAQAVDTLERRGFAVIVMTPAQIMAQGRHIEQTYEQAKEQTT